MTLFKVKGSKSYKGDDSGFKELGTSSAMGSASLSVARQLEGNAEAVGRGTYESANTTVAAGRMNTLRAGAVVREVVPDGRDARDAILLRVAESMRVRNP